MNTNENTPAPDYGEPWQLGIMGFPQAVTNSQGKIMAGNSAVARAVACVNACAGFTDPAAEIASLRQAGIANAQMHLEALDSAAEIAAMREAIMEAHEAITKIANLNGTYCRACGAHFEDQHDPDCYVQPLVTKLQPFLK